MKDEFFTFLFSVVMTTVNVALTAVQIMLTSAFNLITVVKTKISAALTAVQLCQLVPLI